MSINVFADKKEKTDSSNSNRKSLLNVGSKKDDIASARSTKITSVERRIIEKKRFTASKKPKAKRPLRRRSRLLSDDDKRQNDRDLDDVDLDEILEFHQGEETYSENYW